MDIHGRENSKRKKDLAEAAEKRFGLKKREEIANNCER